MPDSINFRMQVPATLYPTLVVRRNDFLAAVEAFDKGESVVVHGTYSGPGCRGDFIPPTPTSFRLLERTETRRGTAWKIDDDDFGTCHIRPT